MECCISLPQAQSSSWIGRCSFSGGPEGADIAGYLSPLSCCNKIPRSGWLINTRNIWLPMVEAESLRSGRPHGRGRAVLQFEDFSLGPHMAEGVGAVWGPLFIFIIFLIN